MASSGLFGKLEADIEIDASPETFFHMWSHKPHHVHHTNSEKVQGVDLHEGDFGIPDSKLNWRFSLDGKAKTAKTVVQTIDQEEKFIIFKHLDGDMMEEYKSLVVKMQALPKKDGKGSIVHWTLEYEKLHEGIGHPDSLLKFLIELSGDMGVHLVKESSHLTGKLETDVEIDASPEKFFHMWTHRPHHMHTSSEKVQGCDLHEGDFGTPGSKLNWRYVHDGKAKTSKTVVEKIDNEKKSITLKKIGGDLMKEYKRFGVTIQASPKKDGKGSIVHWTLEYEMLHEGIGHPDSMLKYFIELTADMGAHLIKEI